MSIACTRDLPGWFSEFKVKPHSVRKVIQGIPCHHWFIDAAIQMAIQGRYRCTQLPLRNRNELQWHYERRFWTLANEPGMNSAAK